jgi:hypothetical protein
MVSSCYDLQSLADRKIANFQALVMHQRSAIREVPTFAGRGSTSWGTSARVVRCLWEGVAPERASAGRRMKKPITGRPDIRVRFTKFQHVLKALIAIRASSRGSLAQAPVAASRWEATMWWRMTKTIIISWFVGLICGVGMVFVLQQENRAPLAESPSSQSPAQTTGMAPDATTRN